MPVRITCPDCRTINTAAESKRGKKIRCEACDIVLGVPAEKKSASEATAVQSSPKLKVKPTSSKSEDNDADPDVSVRKKAGTKRDQPQKKAGASMVLVAVGLVAVMAFLVLGVGGIAAIYYLRSNPAAQVGEQAKVDANEKPNGEPKKADAENKDPIKVAEPKKQADPEPKKKIEPAEPLPSAIGAEQVKRVKRATVYLRVTMPGGQVAEGSGFFAMQPGIVITNAHVLGMLSSSSRPPNQVDVVVHSGDAAEYKLAGQVLGVDRVSDLAVVRVPLDAKLPTPLLVEEDRPVVETQSVYIFGFPFGAKLGRDITVSQSNVSSLRKKDGVLDQIQVNGGMHPGNSGGPVVNALGQVIGVSVAGITGTQINFAVPAEKVSAILDGRISDTKWGEAYADGGQAKLPVRCKCLDPLSSVKEMRVETWVGQAGPIRPASVAIPKVEPGDGQRRLVAVPYKDGTGQIDVMLPELKPGEVCWVQPVITTAKGTRWGEARSISRRIDLLQRVPAELKINFASQKERTATMRSTYTNTVANGAKKSVLTESTDVELAEVVVPENRGGNDGARIFTAFATLNVSLDRDGKKILIPGASTTLKYVRSMPPIFVVNEFNATASYIKNSLKAGMPLREVVDDINTMVHTPFEAATISMPNKLVQPAESFPAKSTMFFRDDVGKVTILDLVLTATYEGKRIRDGRDTAILSVTGDLQGRKDLKGRIDGNITGKVGFDLAGGFLSSVDLVIFADSDESLPGLGSVRREMRNEISIRRVPGNTKGIQVAVGKSPPSSVPAGKIVLNLNESLNDSDPFDRVRTRSRVKVHAIAMEAGKNYVISLNSDVFDTYLRLEDPDQQQVAEDDDSGGGLNARIEYRAVKTGLHKIFATTYNSTTTGPYQLTVVLTDGAIAKADPKNNTPIGDQPPPGWMEAKAKNGLFSVWMPKNGKFGEKESSIIAQGAGQIRIWNMVLERNNGSVYFASQIIVPPQLAMGPPGPRQNMFRDMVAKELNGQVISEKYIKVDVFGGSKEYLIQIPNGMAKFRLIGSGVTIFRTLVIGTKAQVESDDTRIFEESFRYLRGGGSPTPPAKEPPPVVKENPNPVPGGGIANPNPNRFFDGDVTLRHLTFQKSGPLANVVWAKDAKSFFVLQLNGLLQRVSVATGHTEESLEIGKNCSHLAMSGQGLLVCVEGADELWVIQPDKLANVKKKIAIQHVRRATGGVDADIAIVGSRPDRNRGSYQLRTIDLKTGDTLKSHFNLTNYIFAASPDGKYLCVLGGIEQLQRYRIDGANLVLEDSSHRIASNGQSICFSPDSRFVALPSGGGNDSRHPGYIASLKNYATLIFPIGNLKRAVAGYAGGGYPKTVGIDPKSGVILGQSHGRPLLAYSFQPDDLLESYQFPPIQNGQTVEILMSPLGGEAIVRNEGNDLVHVKINKNALNKLPATLAKGNENSDIPAAAGPINNPPPEVIQSGSVGLRNMKLTQTGKIVDVCWAEDGLSYFVLYDSGFLQRVSLLTGRTERNLDIASSCSTLVRTGEGLVVAVQGKGEVWNIDSDSLEIKRRIPVADLIEVSAGNSASFAFVSTKTTIRDVVQLAALDLKKGEVAKAYPNFPVQSFAVSPDGKYLFARGSQDYIRFRIENAELHPEALSHRFTMQPRRICFSPDGKLVAFPQHHGNGNKLPDHPPVKDNSTYIYPANNLNRPITGYGDCRELFCVGIDPVAGVLYAQSVDSHLIVYSFETDRRLSAHDFSGSKQNRTEQFIVSPHGREAIARTAGNDLIHIKLAKDEPVPAEMVARMNAPTVAAGPVASKFAPNPEPRRLDLPGLSTNHLRFFEPNRFLGSTIWAEDGKSVFLLNDEGRLRRINLQSGQTEDEINIGAKCNGLAMSAEGLLVSVSGKGTLWIISPKNLSEVRKRIAVMDVWAIDSAPAASFAFVFGNPDGSALRALMRVDLKEGKVVNVFRDMRYPTFRVSPDGKFLFTQTKQFLLARYRVENEDLALEQESHKMMYTGSSTPGPIHISPDGKYVCWSSNQGNPAVPDFPEMVKGGSVLIYEAGDLKKPVNVLGSSSTNRAVGIDPIAKRFYTQNYVNTFHMFSFDINTKLGDYHLPGIYSGDIVEFSVAPTGGAVVLRTGYALVYLKMTGDGKTTAVPVPPENTKSPSVGELKPPDKVDEKPNKKDTPEEKREQTPPIKLKGGTLTSEKDVANPKPVEFFKGSTTLRSLDFRHKQTIVGDIVWSANGKTFYILADDGVLQRVDAASGQTEQMIHIENTCSSLANSAEGLLVAVSGANQLWVIDYDKMEQVKMKIPLPDIRRVSAGRSASFAYAGSAGSGRSFLLHFVDLKTGEVVKTPIVTNVFNVSPDGKYLCAQGGTEQLVRYPAQGGKWIAEDSSYRIASPNASAVSFSPDGKFVCLVTNIGNGRGHPDHPKELNKPGNVFVYPVDNLKKPAAAFQGGPLVGAIGIDAITGYILTSNYKTSLILFGFGVDEGIDQFQFPAKGLKVIEFAVSPVGGESIVRTNQGLIHVKTNKAGKPPIALQGPDAISVTPPVGITPPPADPVSPMPGKAPTLPSGLGEFLGKWEGRSSNLNETITIELRMGTIIVSGEQRRNGDLVGKFEGKNVVLTDGRLRFDQIYSQRPSPSFGDAALVLSIKGDDMTMEWRRNDIQRGVNRLKRSK